MMELEGLNWIYVIRYIGNIVGSIVILFGMIFSYEDKYHLGYFFIIVNSVTIVFQLIILIIFFVNGNNFADRPIRRIIYSKNVREIRRTEL